MLTAWVPVIVAIVGLLLWALASQPIVKEAGRIAYGCGLLVTLLAVGARTVRLLGG